MMQRREFLGAAAAAAQLPNPLGGSDSADASEGRDEYGPLPADFSHIALDAHSFDPSVEVISYDHDPHTDVEIRVRIDEFGQATISLSEGEARTLARQLLDGVD